MKLKPRSITSTLLLFTLLLPKESFCYNLWVDISQKMPVVYGTVDENDFDIKTTKGTGKVIFDYSTAGISPSMYVRNGVYCHSKKDAAEKINSILSGGAQLHRQSVYGAYRDKVLISCPNNNTTPISQYVLLTEKIPRPAPKCQVNIPDSVNFGTVEWGRSGKKIELSGYVMCNSATSGQLRLLSPIVSNILVKDALVSYAFNEGKNSQRFYTTPYEKEPFSLIFTLDDTGATSGYKQASVVFETTWD